MNNIIPYSELPTDISTGSLPQQDKTKEIPETTTDTKSAFTPSAYTKDLLSKGNNKTMGEELADYDLEGNVASYNFLEGMGVGLKTSTIGTMIRNSLTLMDDISDNRITPVKDYEFTNEDYLEIAEACNYDKTAMAFILQGSYSMRGVRAKLKVRKENNEINDRLAQSSVMTNLAAGFTSILGDPLTLVSFFLPGGQISAGGKFATVAAKIGYTTATEVPMAIGAEWVNEKVTGKEADYWGAALLTAGIGSAVALGGLRRGATQATNVATATTASAGEAGIDSVQALEQSVNRRLTQENLAYLDERQRKFQRQVYKEQEIASKKAQKYNEDYRLSEQERLKNLDDIQASHVEVQTAEELVEDAKQNVITVRQQASEAYAKAQDDQLDLMVRLEEQEKALKKAEENHATALKQRTIEQKAKIKAESERVASLKRTRNRAKNAKARRPAIVERLAKKGETLKNANPFLDALIPEINKELAVAEKRLKALKQEVIEDAASKKIVDDLKKDIEVTKRKISKAEENVRKAKDNVDGRKGTKVREALNNQKEAEDLLTVTRNNRARLNAKHKKIVARSAKAKADFEAYRNKVRKLKKYGARLVESRSSKLRASKSLENRKIPIDEALQHLDRQSRNNLAKAMGTRLGKTPLSEPSKATTNTNPTVNTSATAAEVKTARESLATTTGDSLATTVSENPSLLKRFAQLVPNITKIFELKSYLVSVLENEKTPQSVKDLVHRLVHFEEGVLGSDGHYHRYQSSAPTYMEVMDGFKVADTRFNNQLSDLDNRIRATYPEEQLDEVYEYIYCMIEGNVARASELAPKFGSDPNIKKFIDIQRKSYEERGAALKSRGIIDADADSTFYSPLVLDVEKIFNFLKEHFNGNVSKAKDFIANYLIEGALKDPVYRDRLYKYFLKEKGIEEAKGQQQAFQEWLRKTAREAAEGYIDQGRSMSTNKSIRRGKNLTRYVGESTENYDDFSSGFSFLKKRVPWNVGHSVTLDGKTFSVNNLRVDPIDAHQKYRARSTGVLTDFDAFGGKSFDEVEEMFFEQGAELNKANNMRPNEGEAFHRALTMLHKRAYGMSVTETQEAFGVLDACAQIIKNLAFCSYGTYMGLNSLMEASRALRATGFGAVLKLVPFAGKLFERWANNGFTRDDVASIRGYLIGETMRPLLGYREAIHNGVRKYSSATSAGSINKALGKIAGFTDFVADNSPAGRLLRSVNTKIDDVFETYGMKEILQRAFNPNVKVPRGCFMSDASLRALGISKKEFNDMLFELKQYFVMDKHGNFSLNPNRGLEEFAANNPKSLYIFRRLMKHVRETTMQRRNLDDIFLYERSSKNSLISLAMQFKGFAIQSYRKRFVKSAHQFADGEADLVAEQYLISAGLAGLVTLGTTYVKGLGMGDDDKERYYKRTLGISSFNDLDDPNNVATFISSITLNRMSELSSLAMLVNLTGLGAATKTTYGTTGFGSDDDEDDSLFIHNKNVGQNLINMFPAVNATQNIVSGAIGVTNLATTSLFDTGTTYSQDKEQVLMLQRGITALPNIPYISQALKQKIEEANRRTF